MPNDDKTENDGKFIKLGEQLRRGVAKKHPVTAKDLEAVRQVITQRHRNATKGKDEPEKEQERGR